MKALLNFMQKKITQYTQAEIGKIPELLYFYHYKKIYCAEIFDLELGRNEALAAHQLCYK